MKTMKERFHAALLARGEVVLPSTTRRYVKMSRAGTDKFFYLGKSGALRTGRAIASSVPVSEKFKQQLLEEVPDV